MKTEVAPSPLILLFINGCEHLGTIEITDKRHQISVG